MRTYFISDIHLKNTEERNGEILLRFLHSLLSEGEQLRLVLLGDIFDLWVGGHQAFIQRYQSIVEAFQLLKKEGAEIIYFEGNHDLHLHPFWQNELGARVYTDAHYFDWEGWKIRCEHGDMINLDDTKYLRYREFVRGGFMRILVHTLPGEIWNAFGNWASRTSRSHSTNYRSDHQGKLVQMIRHHAFRSYNEKSFDFILSGHMHVFDDFEFQMGDRHVRSVNLGSWLGDEIKVAVLDANGLHIQTLNQAIT